MSKAQIFLDSGAYSAWVRNIQIDIQEYIAFIKEHQESIEIYAVLDVIGDAKGTYKNQLIMEQAGLNPLPCFHFGEPWHYLERYVARYDYIALGGLAAMGSSPQFFEFLDKAFNIICEPDGMPRVKVHGFAVTSIMAMRRYPWFSVDSTSWLLMSGMGNIYVPHKLPNGDWDYLETLPGRSTRKIAVSTISPSSSKPDGHFITISKQWQDELLEWINYHGGTMGKSSFKKVSPGYKLQEGEKWAALPGIGEFDGGHAFGEQLKKGKAKDKQYVEIIEEQGLCNSYLDRDVLNVKYFKELESRFPTWPYKWERPAMNQLF